MNLGQGRSAYVLRSISDVTSHMGGDLVASRQRCKPIMLIAAGRAALHVTASGPPEMSGSTNSSGSRISPISPCEHLRRGEAKPLMTGAAAGGASYCRRAAMDFRLSRAEVTELLNRWPQRRADDERRLFEAVQGELHRIAAGYMRRERRGHTLQPTALVNEAYLRLAADRGAAWDGRSHFFAIAARVMRQVLVDCARKRHAAKRPDARQRVSASHLADPAGGHDIDVLALHEALSDLAALDSRQADIVALRYFGGLTEQEVAVQKGLSAATIRREIASARCWLGHRMRGL